MVLWLSRKPKAWNNQSSEKLQKTPGNRTGMFGKHWMPPPCQVGKERHDVWALQRTLANAGVSLAQAGKGARAAPPKTLPSSSTHELAAFRHVLQFPELPRPSRNQELSLKGTVGTSGQTQSDDEGTCSMYAGRYSPKTIPHNRHQMGWAGAIQSVSRSL